MSVNSRTSGDRACATRGALNVPRAGGEAVATVLQIDYLVENPYVSMENEYSVFEDGSRQLERQFTQHQFELTNCTEGGNYDDAAVAVKRELAVRAAELYAPIRDGTFAGCSLAFRRDGMEWRGFRGDPHPGGPIESEARDVIARNGEGLWQPTGEVEYRQNGRVVGRTRDTPEGTWVFLPQSGEWRQVSSPGPRPYENPLEYLTHRIASVGVLVNQQGFPISRNDGRVYGHPYTGWVGVDGRTAVRYEGASVSEGVGSAEDLDYGQEGLEFYWRVYDFFEDNPLRYRDSAYWILPDGELAPLWERMVDETELQDCPRDDDEAPTPTPASGRHANAGAARPGNFNPGPNSAAWPGDRVPLRDGCTHP